MAILSEGPNNGIAFSDDSSIGTETWLNVANAVTSNDNRATVFLDTSEVSHYLRAIQFSFNIPASATIVGIEFKLERNDNTLPSDTVTVQDNSIRLVKGGVISGDNKASGVNWPQNDTIKTYGSSSDLWGLTWTPADINAANFGVVVSAKQGGSGTNTAAIDHVTLTVYYCERGVLMSMTQTID